MNKSGLIGSSPPTGNAMVRRRFLGGLAVAAVPLIAGCAQVNSLGEETFDASPVSISPDVSEALGYEELAREPVTTTGEGRAYGIDVRATVTSHIAVYRDADDENGFTAGFLATPRARILFEERNPLAEVSAQPLMYREDLDWFREPAGLAAINQEWGRNSLRLFGNRMDLLGGDMFTTTRAGFLPTDDGTAVVYVHYGKIRLDDEAVFAYAIRQLPVETTDRPFVGEDGYLSEEEIAADVEEVSVLFGALRSE